MSKGLGAPEQNNQLLVSDLLGQPGKRVFFLFYCRKRKVEELVEFYQTVEFWEKNFVDWYFRIWEEFFNHRSAVLKCITPGMKGEIQESLIKPHVDMFSQAKSEVCASLTKGIVQKFFKAMEVPAPTEMNDQMLFVLIKGKYRKKIKSIAKKHNAQELIKFVEEVESFVDYVKKQACFIWDKFILSNSGSAINITAVTRNEIQANMKKLTPDAFTCAKKSANNLLVHDVLPGYFEWSEVLSENEVHEIKSSWVEPPFMRDSLLKYNKPTINPINKKTSVKVKKVHEPSFDDLFGALPDNPIEPTLKLKNRYDQSMTSSQPSTKESDMTDPKSSSSFPSKSPLLLRHQQHIDPHQTTPISSPVESPPSTSPITRRFSEINLDNKEALEKNLENFYARLDKHMAQINNNLDMFKLYINEEIEKQRKLYTDYIEEIKRNVPNDVEEYIPLPIHNKKMKELQNKIVSLESQISEMDSTTDSYHKATYPRRHSDHVRREDDDLWHTKTVVRKSRRVEKPSLHLEPLTIISSKSTPDTLDNSNDYIASLNFGDGEVTTGAPSPIKTPEPSFDYPSSYTTDAIPVVYVPSDFPIYSSLASKTYSLPQSPEVTVIKTKTNSGKQRDRKSERQTSQLVPSVNIGVSPRSSPPGSPSTQQHADSLVSPEDGEKIKRGLLRSRRGLLAPEKPVNL